MTEPTQLPGSEGHPPDSEHGQAAGAASRTAGPAARDKPVCLIVLGMAGSGKTTFVQVRAAKRPPRVS